ncbi:hypothetical protein [Ramlibacter sp. Leaf400]|uniref:hypothetical protein n=1 Tax=Ramlibacter sp. Leaf400 TaxID=1736365 RepID=UPI0006FE1C7E|nr:hypothetical protein [Ramlibacter sp. Leaf400]KQT08108.1 hypothetical protein ASG30_16915 [Ramlibacter sp. Leaf400]
MNRIASALAFASSAAAAALAAFAMSGSAYAETPTIDTTKFTSMRSRAEVRSEALADRARLSSAGSEWLTQQSGPLPRSGMTRAQARAEYIADRDEVLARNSEIGDTSRFASAKGRATMPTMLAGQPAR